MIVELILMLVALIALLYNTGYTTKYSIFNKTGLGLYNIVNVL